jgi:hypothetical protein
MNHACKLLTGSLWLPPSPVACPGMHAVCQATVQAAMVCKPRWYACSYQVPTIRLLNRPDSISLQMLEMLYSPAIPPAAQKATIM